MKMTSSTSRRPQTVLKHILAEQTTKKQIKLPTQDTSPVFPLVSTLPNVILQKCVYNNLTRFIKKEKNEKMDS
jgi:hypothetical protein